MAGDLIHLLADLMEEEVLQVVGERLDAGENPVQILDDARSGMEIVGRRFADGDYFIPDLVYSGEILKEVTDLVKPRMKGASEAKRIGKVIVGTVAGDIHDIGKDIVVFMLDVNGFDVLDLGVDVPAERFVEQIRESGATVVALSGFLTLSYDSMKSIIETIAEAGLRDGVKIMIGGGQINEDIRKYTLADGYGKDAMAAVRFAKEWLSAAQAA